MVNVTIIGFVNLSISMIDLYSHYADISKLVYVTFFQNTGNKVITHVLGPFFSLQVFSDGTASNADVLLLPFPNGCVTGFVSISSARSTCSKCH